jgi:hypothetical protein
MKFLPDERLFVFREGKTFHAVSAVCTHLGCTVRAEALPRPETMEVGGKRRRASRTASPAPATARTTPGDARGLGPGPEGRSPGTTSPSPRRRPARGGPRAGGRPRLPPHRRLRGPPMATAAKSPPPRPRRPRRPPEALLELPAPLRPRGGRRDRLELRPALVPGQGAQAVARLDLLVLARHDQRRALPPPRRLRPPAPLPLRALGRARLRLGEGHRVRGDLRLLDPRGPPPLRPPDGGPSSSTSCGSSSRAPTRTARGGASAGSGTG